MTSKVRKQFREASTSRVKYGDYIRSSLNLMTADTRKGLTPQAKADFTVVAAYAKNHRGRAAAYVERMKKTVDMAGNTPASPVPALPPFMT